MTEQQRERLKMARDALLDVQVQALTARELLVDADEPDNPAPDLPPDLARQVTELTDQLSSVISGVGQLLGEPDE